MPTAPRRPIGLAILALIAGTAGLIAAFVLTIERFASLEDPDAALACDFSVIVQCGANLASAQGAVLGFPNPLLGIAGYAAVIAIGASVLAGAVYRRWFWLAFATGMAIAFGFVVWLIGQSIFVIGTLCPWCMVVWAATIPLFLTAVLHAVRTGAIGLPARARRAASGAYGWIPLITVLSYILIAVLAQIRLDVLGQL